MYDYVYLSRYIPSKKNKQPLFPLTLKGDHGEALHPADKLSKRALCNYIMIDNSDIESNKFFITKSSGLKTTGIFLILQSPKQSPKQSIPKISSKGTLCRCSLKQVFLKFCNSHRKTLVLWSVFNKVAGLNLTATQVFPVNFVKFLEHLC